MSSRRALAAAGALVATLALGSAAGTGALWRSEVPLGAGTLRSGSLELLSGDGQSQVKSYTLGTLAGANLAPGNLVRAPLTLSNGGESALGYRLAQVSATGTEFPAHLGLLVVPVSDAAECPPGIDTAATLDGDLHIYRGALLGASTTTLRSLAPGAAETLCIQVQVAGDAPNSTQSASTQITLTFGAQPT